MKKRQSEVELNQHLDAYLSGVKFENEVGIERSVIGSMLLDPDCADLGTRLLPEMFSDETYRGIFEAMKDLKRGNAQIDVITVSQKVKRISKEITATDVCSISYELGVPSDYFEFYIRILIYQYIRKKYFKALCMAPRVFEGDRIDTFIDDIHDIFRSIDNATSMLESLDDKPAHILEGESEFRPHWLKKNGEYFEVLQSKFDPTKGYAWVNGKARTEDYLLRIGYEKDYEGPPLRYI